MLLIRFYITTAPFCGPVATKIIKNLVDKLFLFSLFSGLYQNVTFFDFLKPFFISRFVYEILPRIQTGHARQLA